MCAHKKGVGDLRAVVAFSDAQLSSLYLRRHSCDKIHQSLPPLIFPASEFKGQALVRKEGEPGNVARIML